MADTTGEISIRSLKDDPEARKCPRCWKYHFVKFNFDGLCDLCQSILLNDFPDHESIPHIKEALHNQRMRFGVWKRDG